MTELVLTRGLPASGKTTWARAWVNEDPENRGRINRDDLRQLLYQRDGMLEHALENNVTIVSHNSVNALLKKGKSVVVDDTHLRQKYIDAWAEIARKAGATLTVQDFTDVPLQTCIDRDAVRCAVGERYVGAQVIRDINMRFQSALKAKSVEVPKSAPYKYVPPNIDFFAYIFDLDGTLATMNGRSPFEWHRVGEDQVVEGVQDLLMNLRHPDMTTIILSGRDEVCRPETEKWLKNNDIEYDRLWMRPTNDNRGDQIIKLELFQKHIAPYYHVLGVVDDRPKVCRMWREIGLQVFQVGDPDHEF